MPPRPTHLRTNYTFFITLLTGAVNANVLALFSLSLFLFHISRGPISVAIYVMFAVADKKPAHVLFIDQEGSSPEAEEPRS